MPEMRWAVYLCCVLVCYGLSLPRVKVLHIRMIPIVEKFLCISWANARPKKQNYQLEQSQHRGVGVKVRLGSALYSRAGVSPRPPKGATLLRVVRKVNLSPISSAAVCLTELYGCVMHAPLVLHGLSIKKGENLHFHLDNSILRQPDLCQHLFQRRAPPNRHTHTHTFNNKSTHWPKFTIKNKCYIHIQNYNYIHLYY